MMFRKTALPLLLLALAASAHAGDVNLTATVTPTKTLKYAQLGLLFDASSVFGSNTVTVEFVALANGATVLPGGTATAVSKSFSNEFNLPVLGYTLLGLYDTGSGLSAALGYDPAVASGLIGHNWPYVDPYGEDRFVDNYFTFDGHLNPDTLNIFGHLVYNSGQAASLGEDIAIVDFSQGEDGGTVSNIAISPVPEPSALAAVGLGLAAVLRRRR